MDVAISEREQGFLLIADMEGSTESKFRLGEARAFDVLREHNRLVIERCRKAEPTPGVILASLGDSIVAKFPAGRDEGSRRRALASCLAAARNIVAAFETLPPFRGEDGVEFPLRTKLALQFYDAYLYGRREELAELAEELVGPHIDVAFRVAPLAWRLQVVATERFAAELLRQSEPPAHEGSALELVRAAHAAREAAAEIPRPGAPIREARTLECDGTRIDYWITDAREVARLKGIPESQRIFLVCFEAPESHALRGQRARLTLKLRQDHHAVVLAKVAVPAGRNDDFIDYVLEAFADSDGGSRLESELTLCAAAKIYGEFDFFFRVSCIDDESLRRFFAAISHERFGIQSVEVRSTIADRFYVSPHYERILEHHRGRPELLVLTWFERGAGDLFQRFVYAMEEGPGERVRPVEILEAGEVIHHTPVYALFLCESLSAYASFFADQHLNPTACRSHVGQISGPGDLRLRYGLMSGVWVPSRSRVARTTRP